MASWYTDLFLGWHLIAVPDKLSRFGATNVILITGTILLESEQELLEVREALVRRARRSRNDDGCIDYQFSVSLDNAREIRLIELWESDEKLQAHLAVPDPEFAEVIGRGKIETAEVDAHVVTSSREMLRR